MERLGGCGQSQRAACACLSISRWIRLSGDRDRHGHIGKRPSPGTFGEGRFRLWWSGQAFAPTLVATFGKISDSGVVRRRCQKPRPDRIRNKPAAPKATKAETSMIWPICHHP